MREKVFIIQLWHFTACDIMFYGTLKKQYRDIFLIMKLVNQLYTKCSIMFLLFYCSVGGTAWIGPVQQSEKSAIYRVRVWGKEQFPEPDFESSWLPMDTNS